MTFTLKYFKHYNPRAPRSANKNSYPHVTPNVNTMMMIGNDVQSTIGPPSKIIGIPTNDLSAERFKKKILQPRNHFQILFMSTSY